MLEFKGFMAGGKISLSGFEIFSFKIFWRQNSLTIEEFPETAL